MLKWLFCFFLPTNFFVSFKKYIFFCSFFPLKVWKDFSLSLFDNLPIKRTPILRIKLISCLVSVYMCFLLKYHGSWIVFRRVAPEFTPRRRLTHYTNFQLKILKGFTALSITIQSVTIQYCDIQKILYYNYRQKNSLYSKSIELFYAPNVKVFLIFCCISIFRIHTNFHH